MLATCRILPRAQKGNHRHHVVSEGKRHPAVPAFRSQMSSTTHLSGLICAVFSVLIP